MIPLSTPLDTSSFDRLLEVARGELPNLVPEWTDYNISDPGITLVELLAWLADTQIYSLARDRADERRAMAALLGEVAAGASPANGTLFPLDPVAMPVSVARNERFLPEGATAPRLESRHDCSLWPVSIASIAVQTPTGRSDVTSVEAQANATFEPFGEGNDPASSLEIMLAGPLADGPVSLNLGFELAINSTPEVAALSSLLIDYVADGAGPQQVEIVNDDSAGLQRSGVMQLRFTAIGAASQHLFRLRSNGAALHPAIHRITPNAVSVLQQASLPIDPVSGTGLADQSMELELASFLGADEPSGDFVWQLSSRTEPVIQVEEGGQWQRWNALPEVSAFAAAGPSDRLYTIGESRERGRLAIHFGNGINGYCPPLDAQIGVELTITAGAQGNIAGTLDWMKPGLGLRWRNSQPVSGGSDAEDVPQLLKKLRARMERNRPLANAGQIRQAAYALPVAIAPSRAEVIEGWEPDRRRPCTQATRTLILTRGDSAAENRSWLDIVGRQLRERIVLGERLVIAAPDWRDFRIIVSAIAAPGRDRAEVAAAIAAELNKQLHPGSAAGHSWPLGRSVTALAIQGWLRRVSGVASVSSVKLADLNGRELGTAWHDYRRHSLPRFHATANDIMVHPSGAKW